MAHVFQRWLWLLGERIVKGGEQKTGDHAAVIFSGLGESDAGWGPWWRWIERSKWGPGYLGVRAPGPLQWMQHGVSEQE